MIKTENKTMRIGVIMAVIALITLIGLAGTFAKYVSYGTGSDTARVAKWGLNVPATLETGNLFSIAYKDTSVDPDTENAWVHSGDSSNVIAPGTHGQETFTIAKIDGSAPEVAYEFGVKVTCNASDETKAAINKLVEEGHFTMTGTKANGEEVTLAKDGAETTLDGFCTALTTKEDYKPGELPQEEPGVDQKMTLTWQWLFEGGADVDQSAWDVLDTSTGNAAALGNIGDFTFKYDITAEQIHRDPVPRP